MKLTFYNSGRVEGGGDDKDRENDKMKGNFRLLFHINSYLLAVYGN